MKAMRGWRRGRRGEGAGWLVAAAVVGAGMAPAPAAAQSVHGLVLYSHTDAPVSLATVRLIRDDGTVAAAGLTDERGRFDVAIPVASTYSVHVSHLTGLDMMDGPLDLSTDANTMVTFHLVPNPIMLDEIEVTVEARIPALDRAGFYERRRNGLGFYMDEVDVERRNPFFASDLFRMIPGVRILQANGIAGVGGYPVMQYALRNQMSTQGRLCFPRVYMDGVVMEFGGTLFTPLSGFDDMVPARDIAAVEVYRSPVEAPAQFSGGCGAILIWTKQGLRRR